MKKQIIIKMDKVDRANLKCEVRIAGSPAFSITLDGPRYEVVSKDTTLIGLQRTIPPGIVFSLRTLATILALDAALDGIRPGQNWNFRLERADAITGRFLAHSDVGTYTVYLLDMQCSD